MKRIALLIFISGFMVIGAIGYCIYMGLWLGYYWTAKIIDKEIKK
jgi:hypothetical protein